jgi:hypothetical protein
LQTGILVSGLKSVEAQVYRSLEILLGGCTFDQRVIFSVSNFNTHPSSYYHTIAAHLRTDNQPLKISIISTSQKKFSNICQHLTFTMDGFIQGQTDVLIVGAGPAGCMAASTLARYGIDFRLIDKRAARTQAGHASGKKTTTFVAAPSDF